MYIKVCNVEDFAVYAKDLEPQMKVIGFWKSEIVKVIVLVDEYDAVDKQKCLESFSSSDFKYFTTDSLK